MHDPRISTGGGFGGGADGGADGGSFIRACW